MQGGASSPPKMCYLGEAYVLQYVSPRHDPEQQLIVLLTCLGGTHAARVGVL